jgi:parallel beta-helix repeat protein
MWASRASTAPLKTESMKILPILVLIGCVAYGGLAEAATYYVAQNGNDGRSCTQAQSASTPKLTVNNGVSCLHAGDTLLVRGGTYDEALIDNIPSGTSWASPVRIAAFPGETVWMSPTSSMYVVYLANVEHYIELDGINMNATNVADGVVKIEGWSGGNAHHIRVKNAELVGSPNASSQLVIVTASVANIVGGNEFINLTVHRGCCSDFNHGFYVQSSNNLIDSCRIFDISGAGVQIYNGYGVSPDGNVVRNNVIHDGRSTGTGQRGWGIITAGGTGNRLYNNIVYNIRNAADGSAGIYVYAGTGTGVYNNTVYGASGYGIVVEPSASDTTITNNISYSNARGDYRDSGAGTKGSTNLTGTNPLFVNPSAGNFQLQAGSPAINAGTAISLVPTDFNGAPRPYGGAYDIGAYEFGSQPVPPPVPVNLRLAAN